MKTPELIAQWVIDNRYPKSENNKVTDSEMYHELVESIRKLVNGNVASDGVSERYSKDDIRKYGNDWKITTWHEGQHRRIIMADGYKTRDEAEHDREIFNAR